MRRTPWSSKLVALAATGVLTVMSGCGADRGAGEPEATGEPAATSESVPAGGSDGADATSITARPTIGTPGPAPGPVGGPGSPVPFVAGEVSVKLDAGEYRVGGKIRVTVSNGMDRPVYTEDFKTVCSIAILQRKDGGGWTDITGCALGRPTVTVTIGPGLGQRIEIDPASFHLTRGGPGGPAFGAGTYRVKFTYRGEPTLGGEDPFTAYSPEFTIR
ncbi:MAG TPA: hypothetical protein VGR06_17390 [Actinophytocola sp.]|jgi:hypothetical protein|uniref:hypothetical protein n=1 Tax=Actinophytocola sp. TaxID=1872138 RepID=UPI002E0A1625|nr:hypothetical protein [Actinophytocola sp.]